MLLLIAALCMPPLINGSGEHVRPHSTSPFRLPHLPNQPRVLLVFGGVDLPASAERRRSLPRRRGRCAGDHAGWKPARGEVMRRRAAERTPALLGAALLSMGVGLGCASGW